MREYIKNLALVTGFKLKLQPDGRMDLNEYVYSFAWALLNSVWVYFEDGEPAIGKKTRFLAINGEIVEGFYFDDIPYGKVIKSADGRFLDVCVFNRWQPIGQGGGND